MQREKGYGQKLCQRGNFSRYSLLGRVRKAVPIVQHNNEIESLSLSASGHSRATWFEVFLVIFVQIVFFFLRFRLLSFYQLLI